MLPEESISLLKSVLKVKYNELNREEVMALVAAHQEEYITDNRLQQLLDTHGLKSNKILSTLVDRGYLEADGVGRGTKYLLTDVFKNENDIKEKLAVENNDNNIKLNSDEIRILDACC